MATKWNFPKRFDNDIAEDGIWFEVVDENGNEWGAFKCQLIDKTTQRWKNAVARVVRERQRGNSKVEHTNADLFVEMSLLDWRLKDGNGKAVAFSKDEAKDYFRQPEAEFVLEQLNARASDVTNYQPEGDPSKN